MEKILIKHTDLEVSRLALGMMRIADLTVTEVEKLVEEALNQGINFFDHADIYGRTKSEQLFGEVLRAHPQWRKQMIIQTKCAIVPGQRYDFSKEHIINSVNESLERLQCGSIDLLLLHRPDALCDPKEVNEAFNQLLAEKKVRYFGVSNHTPYQIELLKKYVDVPLVVNQLQLSIVHSGMIDAGLNMNMTNSPSIDHDGGVLDYCRLHDITIQPWSVVQASWEEGTFLNNPDYKCLNEKLEELAQKYNVQPNAIAVAWLLRHPAQMQPIVGTASASRLIQLCESTTVQLTRQEWYDIYLASGKTLP